nr:DNA repair protein RecO [Lacticigenium naphthae]
MSNLEEVEGIVLSVRKHKERDFLVKIFTNTHGKLMFFVRGSKKPTDSLRSAILPFSYGTYIADIRSDGLSFLRDVKDIHHFTSMQTDIFKNAYATYILSLLDAALEDKIKNPGLFEQLKLGLSAIDEGEDPEIIMNIFEVRFLYHFGVMPNLNSCVFCGETQGKFDFSSVHNGILCERHWVEDERRYQATARAVHFLRLFSILSFDRVGKITLKEETKKEIRWLIDQIYEEYVGLHLKSKKFIDNMYKWEAVLKKRPAQKNGTENEN